jgi:hypothetical protein
MGRRVGVVITDRIQGKNAAALADLPLGARGGCTLPVPVPIISHRSPIIIPIPPAKKEGGREIRAAASAPYRGKRSEKPRPIG